MNDMPLRNDDPFSAHGHIFRAGRPGGPLSGLQFALKDLFDVAGVPTGAGNPDWLATHPIPETDAEIVRILLDAGADLVGKTKTDEIAWSLTGQNAHYGTPRNAAAPDRIPGGSSSGSASATSAGLVDFAIGTDTGGSVRIPASFCGLYGLRPNHGRISLDGAVALAPSYDTLGWFARDAETFARVGAVIFGTSSPATPPRRLLIAEDLFDVAEPAVRQALSGAIARATELIGAPQTVTVAGDDLAAWRNAYRVLQSAEAWQEHEAWISASRPTFGPGIRERFQAASQLDPAEVTAAAAIRAAVRDRLAELLQDDAVMLVPAAPSPAPLLTADEATLDEMRTRILGLTCPAGHAGLPQMSLPLGRVDGLPVGLGIIGAAGTDERLLDLAVRLGGS